MSDSELTAIVIVACVLIVTTGIVAYEWVRKP